jgi:hypothetical protein
MKRLGRSRDWVYRHAEALGAVRTGEGVRPRLRFYPAKVAAYLDRLRDEQCDGNRFQPSFGLAEVLSSDRVTRPS